MMNALQTLYLSGTQIADITLLAGMNNLQTWTSAERKSQIYPLSAPVKISPMALQNLWLFLERPWPRQDRCWEMLSGLNNETAAKDVVLYLKGQHPDLQPPTEGVVVPAGQPGMNAASPVLLEDNNCLAEIADTRAFQRPISSDPATLEDHLIGLHATAQNTVEELRAGRNVNADLIRRVDRYADASNLETKPSFALLESAMVLVRPMVADPYTTDPLDPGLIAALQRLVDEHDALKIPNATPSPLPDLPKTPETPQDTAQVMQVIDDLKQLVEQTAKKGVTGNTVVVAINSTVDVANAANAPIPAGDTAKAQDQKGWWPWALRMSGGLAKALENYGKLHKWSATPAGQAVMARLSEIIAVLVQFFTRAS